MNLRRLGQTLFLATSLLCSANAALGLEQGQQAPDFTLPDIAEGKPPITLSALRGKTVYVDFWASWCAPCLRSMPLINELYARYRDQGFEVIAINVDDPIEDGREFLLDTPLDYLIAADTKGEMLGAYAVRGMPTSFLIDRDGVVRMVHTGFRDNDIVLIEDAVRSLLATPTP
jgi:cytochrome c biogenesis protein CcmG/thiol:disulfide interchange protein DsbE